MNILIVLLSLFIFGVTCKIISHFVDEYRFHCWYRANSDKTMEELLNEGAESLSYLTKSYVNHCKDEVCDDLSEEILQDSPFTILEYQDV